MAGFEPAHDGIKTRCLTAWRHPSNAFSIETLNLIINEKIINNQILLQLLMQCRLFYSSSDKN